MIFADSVLIGMCQNMPKDENELLQVSGVGQVKLERYGKEFLKIFKNYIK